MAWCAAALFVIIGLIVAYEVVMRYVFLAPTRWVEEIARVLQIYGVFLACAWLVGRREHIRITALTARVRPAIRAWFERIALLCIAAIAAACTWASVELIRFSIDMAQYTDSVLALPMWLVQLPVPVGLALVTAQAIACIVWSGDGSRADEPPTF